MNNKSYAQHIFALNMKKRRLQLKISQEKLGELSGLHRTYIGGIEQCVRNPSLLSMEKIAKALKIELSILLSFDYDTICNSEYAICNYSNGEFHFYSLDSDLLDENYKQSLS